MRRSGLRRSRSRSRRYRGRWLLLVLVVGVAAGLADTVPVARAQRVTEEHKRVLEVRQRQLDLRASRAEYERAQRLFEEGLVSRADLDRARTVLEAAQLLYQQSVLSLLNLQPRLAIEKAVKHQTSEGRKLVRLTVTNDTPTFDDTQFELLNNFEGADPIPEELRTRDIRDIFISLQDSGGDSVPRGTAIALPYEQHIPKLEYGESTTVEFQCLRDVNHLLVAATYQGETREIDIQLEQADTGSVVNVSSTQISQEGDLGSQVVYTLSLERSSVDVRSFQLRALDLPREIGYSFVDPETEARLSQLNFPAGVSEQDLELRLFLPEQASEQVPVDQPVEFWAVASQNGALPVRGEDQPPYSPEEVRESGAGFLHLELVPRGVGRIEVAASPLFSEIQVGDVVRASLTVRNTGTRRLDAVRFAGDGPLGWRFEIAPQELTSLELNREASVDFHIIPPEDVAVGDYEVRLETESFAYNRSVPSEDKIFRVSIKPRSSLVTTAILSVILLGLVAGAAVFGIRLARR